MESNLSHLHTTVTPSDYADSDVAKGSTHPEAVSTEANPASASPSAITEADTHRILAELLHLQTHGNRASSTGPAGVGEESFASLFDAIAEHGDTWTTTELPMKDHRIIFEDSHVPLSAEQTKKALSYLDAMYQDHDDDFPTSF